MGLEKRKNVGGRPSEGVLRKLTSGGSSAWSPSSKSGLLFWFDATNGVTKDGSDLVSQWDDRSGNGRHATASGSDRPLWEGGQLNGRPGIYFDASNYMSFGSDNLFASGSEFCFWAVMQAEAGDETWYRTLVTIKSATTNRNFSALISNNTTTYGQLWWAYAGASPSSARAVAVASADYLTAPARLVINYTGGDTEAAASWQAYRNGVGLTDAQAAGSASHTNSANRIGAWGTSPAPSFGWSGHIFEMGAYDSQLSDDERTELAAYLAAKWGV